MHKIYKELQHLNNNYCPKTLISKLYTRYTQTNNSCLKKQLFFVYIKKTDCGSYNLGHLLQLDFPFFLYFLQHFFFFPPHAISQSRAEQGEYKDGISVFCTFINFY